MLSNVITDETIEQDELVRIEDLRPIAAEFDLELVAAVPASLKRHYICFERKSLGCWRNDKLLAMGAAEFREFCEDLATPPEMDPEERAEWLAAERESRKPARRISGRYKRMDR